MRPKIASSKENFFKNRASEIQGALLLFIAFYLLISFWSYDSSDSSMNVANNEAVKNFGGRFGAFVADPFLQFFGLGVAIFVLAPFVWGMKFFKKTDVKLFWLRIVMLLITLPAFAALLAVFDTPESWPFQSFGGYIGMFILQKTENLISLPAFTLIMTATFVFALYYTLAVSFYGWIEVFAKIYYYIKIFVYYGSKIIKKIIGLFTGKNIAVSEPPKKEAFVRKEPEISRGKYKRDPKSAQKSLNLSLPDRFELPSIEFLSEPPKVKKNQLSESALQNNAKMLERVLEDFGVYGKITKISPGPVVTLYELEPSPGTKSSRVIGLADDISRSMSAISARIAVVAGKNAIGIELPNANRETVYFRELIESEEYKNSDNKLPLGLGKNIGGEPIVVDLTRMPHLLVAGTTGSGKSVAVNTMILSLLYKYSPEECKFIMIDPKMLELSVYDGIPHLLSPVVTEPKKAIVALKWVVKEMENRYRLMSHLNVRNIAGYNKRIETAAKDGEALSRSVQTGFEVETGKPIFENVPIPTNQLPFIVVVVDEMADLMIVAGKEIEGSIQRLAQMARAAGIHIIMATQRPSVDVITGVIKANFPTRISFQVTSRIDSRTILNEQGAEQLLGMGDMLYMSGGSRIIRVHGPFVSDEEVSTVVKFLKEQGTPNYVEDVTADDGEMANFGEFGGEGGSGDDLYDQAVQIVLRDRKASTSYIQRCLKIGYNRAATIIEKMEKEGIVSPPNHVGKREILQGE